MIFILIFYFLVVYFNSFLNNYLFFKFINKCQKEILRCTSPYSRVCDFFYVSLFTFEGIFCWIAWIAFRWVSALFSFCFNSHKTNYVCKEGKKEFKKSCWLNNVHLWLISRLDFVWFQKFLLVILLNKERQRKSLQGRIQTIFGHSNFYGIVTNARPKA